MEPPSNFQLEIGHLQFKGKAQFKTWLGRIVSNHCSTRRKEMRREDRLQPISQMSTQETPGSGSDLYDLIFGASRDHDPLQHTLDRELAEIVRRAIIVLPRKFRDVLVLRVVKGMTAKEVAEARFDNVKRAHRDRVKGTHLQVNGS